MSNALRLRVDARPTAEHPLHLRINSEFPCGEVSALFGPSGAGKTTTLRVLAGLEQTINANVAFAGDTWQSADQWVPAHARNMAYVFQQAALFPHLSVAQNLAFAERRAIAPTNSPATEAMLATLSISELLARRPADLSGGERQRVALARALLRRPRLLLLDEPLSALDDARRQAVMHTIERLCRDDGVTIIYVSHAVDEIARLAKHIVVLSDGQSVQQGGWEALQATTDAHGLLEGGRGSILSGTLGPIDSAWHLQPLQIGDNSLWLPQQSADAGAPMRVRVLAKDVSLALHDHADTSILNRLPARIDAIDSDASPSAALVTLRVETQLLYASITRKSLAQLALTPGQSVFAQIKSVALLA
ncbi:MAG: molybdenum ABC transporter ATP-binding protein [Pseudomonadota bacterium]